MFRSAVAARRNVVAGVEALRTVGFTPAGTLRHQGALLGVQPAPSRSKKTAKSSRPQKSWREKCVP